MVKQKRIRREIKNQALLLQAANIRLCLFWGDKDTRLLHWQLYSVIFNTWVLLAFSLSFSCFIVSFSLIWLRQFCLAACSAPTLLQTSASQRPTRTGQRRLASDWVEPGPVTSSRWWRAAAPTWRACSQATRWWTSRARTWPTSALRRWSPWLRPSRRCRPASEWCRALSRWPPKPILCVEN